MSRSNELRIHLGSACGPYVQVRDLEVPADSQVEINVALAMKRGLPVHGPTLAALGQNKHGRAPFRPRASMKGLNKAGVRQLPHDSNFKQMTGEK